MEIYVAEIPHLVGFTSKELDAETSLYHLAARSYPQDPPDDPWSGRFEETDPLADLSAGESPYIYSNDDPVEFSDPSGEYSYEINGVPVSNQVGQSFMSSADIGQYQLAQQHQAYEQWQSIVNWQPSSATSTQSMMPLAAPDMSSPTAVTLGTAKVHSNALKFNLDWLYLMSAAGGESGFNKVEMAQWMYVILNRARIDKLSVQSVVTAPGQFNGFFNPIGQAIFTGGGGVTRQLALEAYQGVISGSIPNLIGESTNAGNFADWNGNSWTFSTAREVYLTQIASGTDFGTIALPEFSVRFIGNSVFFNNPY